MTSSTATGRTTEPTRSLRLSVADGMGHAVMLGLGESYLGALAVELGHAGTSLALLATIPLLVGATTQLGSEWFAKRVGGRKRAVVVGATVQALTHVGFVAIAAWRIHALIPFLVVKTLFWTAGTAIGPAWNDWIGDMTEGVDRARYFGRRSAMVQGALVLSFLAGGRWLAATDAALDAFAVLFVCAAFGRLLSAALLALQIDRVVLPARLASGPSGERLPWRTGLYVAALWFGAMVSIPFFTPYMLTHLRLDYATFSGLFAISIVAKVAALPFCHRWVRRWGLPKLLIAAGAGVAVIPLWWALATNIAALVGLEIFGGVAWAAWEYATFQLLLEGSSGRVRMRFLGVTGALTGTAQVLGSLLGGQLIDSLGLAYTELFLVSAALRSASLLLLVATLPDRISHGPWPRLFLRLVSLRPSGGAAARPIVSDAPDGRTDRNRRSR